MKLFNLEQDVQITININFFFENLSHAFSMHAIHFRKKKTTSIPFISTKILMKCNYLKVFSMKKKYISIINQKRCFKDKNRKINLATSTKTCSTISKDSSEHIFLKIKEENL